MSLGLPHRAAVLALWLAAPVATTAQPPAEPPWRELTTTSFTIYSSAPEHALRTMARRLETLRAVLDRLHADAALQSPRPTLIYMFGSDEEFAPYAPQPDAEVGGYFMERTDGNFVALPSPLGTSRAIFHEYLHYFMAHNMPHLPLWLNEGMAAVYESLDIFDDHVEIGKVAPHCVRTLRSEPLLPLADLFRVTVDSEAYTGGDAQKVFYAQSWALSHYVQIGRPELAPKLKEFLQRLGQGQDVEAAFGASFKTTYAEFEEELAAYIRQTELRTIRIPIDTSDVLVGGEMRVLPRAEVLARLGILLAQVGPARLEQAGEHLARALELSPDLGLAHLGMGYVLQRRGLTDEALAEFRRAASLDAADDLPWLGQGRILLERFATRGGSGEGATAGRIDLLAQAESFLREALQRNPRRADTYKALGRVLLLDHSCDEGPRVLKKAWQMLPSDVEVASDLAMLLALCDEADAARYIIREFLDPYADSAVASKAKQYVIRRELERAEELARAGKPEQATAKLASAREYTDDADLKEEIARRLVLLHKAAAGRAAQELFDEALRAANAGDHEGALELAQRFREALDQRDPAGTDPDAARSRVTISQFVEHVRARMQYEQANRLAREGELQEAIRLFEQVERRLARLLDTAADGTGTKSMAGDRRAAGLALIDCWEALYRQAVELVTEGERSRGAELIREVIEGSPDPDMVDSARRVLRELEQ